MHRNIVPAEEKLTSPEGAVGLLPSHKQICDDSRQEPVQFWKTPFQQYGKVDTLRIIIELSPIYREPRRPGKWLGQTLCVKQEPHVITNPAFNGIRATTISCEPFDLC